MIRTVLIAVVLIVGTAAVASSPPGRPPLRRIVRPSRRFETTEGAFFAWLMEHP